MAMEFMVPNHGVCITTQQKVSPGEFSCFFCILVGRNMLEVINLFHPGVAFYIQASHLICSQNRYVFFSVLNATLARI